MYSAIAANKRKSAFIIAIFIILILALGWIFEQASDTYAPILLYAAIIAVIMPLISYFSGDKIALTVSGARAIKKEDNPYVYRLVENLCIATGIPTPAVYIIDDPAINAFATGRDPKHASIAVTRGAIEKLANEELEGIIAHELSHIKNYDIRFMMLVAVLVGVIVILSDLFIRGRLFAGHGRRNQVGGALLLIGIALAILSPLIAELIKLAVSRRRELLADASGALATRYPQGLANALKKISQENLPMGNANHAMAHLYLANPFGARLLRGWNKLWATHPPLLERIAALEKMGHAA